MIIGLDHIQIAMPQGEEDKVRQYYCDVLGFEEIPKPTPLIERGGVWFLLPDKTQVHYGIKPDFIPETKAHPAFLCSDLDGLAQKLEEADYPIKWDTALAPRRRFYSVDPVGNRLEFLD